MPETPTEKPEDKDLQDHRFGMTAAEREEEAERRGADGAGRGQSEREPEPHAGGKA